jgi:hypothetical protein
VLSGSKLDVFYVKKLKICVKTSCVSECTLWQFCILTRLCACRLLKDSARYSMNRVNTTIFNDCVMVLKSDLFLITGSSALIFPDVFTDFVHKLYSRVPTITTGLAMLYSRHSCFLNVATTATHLLRPSQLQPTFP